MPHEPSSLVPRCGTPQDLRVCRAILARGSRSFSAASLVLPARVRAPSAAFYAFCRVADDAVDLGDDPSRAIEGLRHRLDRIHAGHPHDEAVDRVLADVVATHGIARPLLDALLEGFAWDAEGRAYETFSDLLAYCVRVASTVGVVMTLIMGRRDRHVLARACDLGVAMQLTNIARDIGEDARRGRVYLPQAWLREAGIDAQAFLAHPTFTPALGILVERLLDQADVLYGRSRAGMGSLPPDCRPAIRAAGWIYRDIGRVLRKRSHDSVSSRARVGAIRKMMLVARALWIRHDPDRRLEVPPIPEASFLIEATEAA